MNKYVQSRREMIKEMANAEKWAEMGEKPKKLKDWEEREVELQELMKRN